jgi:hypothetical protein
MKATVVPAQVTTVEDRIMGNLGFSQLVLFIIPVFVGAGFFILLPPLMHGSLYKYIVIVCLSLISGILAIRIKGKIVLLWLVTILRYNLRSKYYLFNKNVTSYREDYRSHQLEPEPEIKQQLTKQQNALPRLGFHEAAQILATIEKPGSNLRFEMTKKGGLNVRLTEVED